MLEESRLPSPSAVTVTFTLGTLALAQCRWWNRSQCRSRKGACCFSSLQCQKSIWHPPESSTWRSWTRNSGWSCQWMSGLSGYSYSHWESQGWCLLLTSDCPWALWGSWGDACCPFLREYVSHNLGGVNKYIFSFYHHFGYHLFYIIIIIFLSSSNSLSFFYHLQIHCHFASASVVCLAIIFYMLKILYTTTYYCLYLYDKKWIKEQMNTEIQS